MLSRSCGGGWTPRGPTRCAPAARTAVAAAALGSGSPPRCWRLMLVAAAPAGAAARLLQAAVPGMPADLDWAAAGLSARVAAWRTPAVWAAEACVVAAPPTGPAAMVRQAPGRASVRPAHHSSATFREGRLVMVANHEGPALGPISSF